jgi:hypothetical protein
MKINDYIDNEFGITKEKKEEENKEDKQW